MSDDLVKRLSARSDPNCRDAAARLEALQAEVARRVHWCACPSPKPAVVAYESIDGRPMLCSKCKGVPGEMFAASKRETDLEAEVARLTAERQNVRREALEEAARWHDEQADKYRQRLANQAKRRDIPAIEANIGGVAVGFSGNHVSELREALQDEISSHEISAKNIRALAGIEKAR